MTVEATANPPGAEAQPSPEDRLARMFGEKPAEEAKADPEPQEPEATDEPEDEPAAEATDEAEVTEEAESTDEETSDIEIDGETYSVPKKLEGAFLKEKDYRQKTQEVAEKRRAIDEREKFLGEVEKVRGAIFEKAAEVKAVEKRLDAYDKLDWRALAGQLEAAEYNKLRLDYDELTRERSKLQDEIRGIVSQQEQLSAQQRQQLIQKGNEELSKEKWWSPDYGPKLLQDSKAYGFSDEELAQVNDPRFVKVLHDAKQWRDLQKSKSTIVKKKVEQAKPITVKAARSATTNQQAGQVEAAKAMVKKTGNPKHAEDALFRLFDKQRKR